MNFSRDKKYFQNFRIQIFSEIGSKYLYRAITVSN